MLEVTFTEHKSTITPHCIILTEGSSFEPYVDVRRRIIFNVVYGISHNF